MALHILHISLRLTDAYVFPGSGPPPIRVQQPQSGGGAASLSLPTTASRRRGGPRLPPVRHPFQGPSQQVQSAAAHAESSLDPSAVKPVRHMWPEF